MTIPKAVVAVAAVVAFLAPSPLLAGPTSYFCQITEFHQPPGSSPNTAWVGEHAMKQPVAIDRLSGRVIHHWIGNTGSAVVRVLDPGSPDWSFKVIAQVSADTDTHKQARYYEVHEYMPGRRKPFLAVADGDIFMGHCE